MVKIAYLVLCHKYPNQIRRLVDSLKDTGYFYVFVDKKTDLAEFKKCLCDCPNVSVQEDRFAVSWGGWSIVKAYLTMLVEAYNSTENFDRFVFMTGNDYPIMTNREIINEFEKNKDVEYIMAYNLSNSPVPTDINKIQKKWFLDTWMLPRFFAKAYGSLMYRLCTRPFSSNRKTVPLNGKESDVFFGQMLSAFTREGARILIDTYENDKKFNSMMKHFHAPDELYWHTVIFNSFLREKTIQNGAEHAITEHFGWAPLHYHHYDVVASEFTSDDYDELINSGYMFFKKAVPGKSDKLMDMIDRYRESL